MYIVRTPAEHARRIRRDLAHDEPLFAQFRMPTGREEFHRITAVRTVRGVVIAYSPTTRAWLPIVTAYPTGGTYD